MLKLFQFTLVKKKQQSCTGLQMHLNSTAGFVVKCLPNGNYLSYNLHSVK